MGVVKEKPTVVAPSTFSDRAPSYPGRKPDTFGPSSSTDNAISRFDGTTGKYFQNSLVTVDDLGNVNAPSGMQYLVGGVQHQHGSTNVLASQRIVVDTTTELTTDGSILCNKATVMSVTMLAATGSGRVRTVKNLGVGTVTVYGAEFETIDEETIQTLYQGDSMTLQDYSSGTWAII